MKKVLKKLKINEIQKENLSSKELQRIVGGACGCAGSCGTDSGLEDYVMSLIAKATYCGCG